MENNTTKKQEDFLEILKGLECSIKERKDTSQNSAYLCNALNIANILAIQESLRLLREYNNDKSSDKS
jgi:hypothetical protein